MFAGRVAEAPPLFLPPGNRREMLPCWVGRNAGAALVFSARAMDAASPHGGG
jgi:hypothetical protein